METLTFVLDSSVRLPCDALVGQRTCRNNGKYRETTRNLRCCGIHVNMLKKHSHACIDHDSGQKCNERHECAICMCDATGKRHSIRLEPCEHVFHKKCIEKWVTSSGGKTSCPLCRGTIKNASLVMMAAEAAATSVVPRRVETRDGFVYRPFDENTRPFDEVETHYRDVDPEGYWRFLEFVLGYESDNMFLYEGLMNESANLRDTYAYYRRVMEG